jgi:trehalose/maltose hydrolase-like predicted phosphorylase
VYRGRDDLPQGWINDLVIRFVAGVRPEGNRLVIDPLPCGVDRLKLDRLPFRGRRVGVAIAGGGVKVSVDGAVTAEGPLGGVLTIAF